MYNPCRSVAGTGGRRCLWIMCRYYRVLYERLCCKSVYHSCSNPLGCASCPCFCLDQTGAHALTDTVPSACTKVLSYIVGNCGHHCIVYQYRKLVCFRCCGISCNCCSTFLARPDFICGEYGSDVERRCFRPFLQNSAVPCILLTSGNSCTRTVIQKLNETEALFDQKTFCYELKIKGLLCETVPLTYYASMRLFFLLFGGNPIFVSEARDLLDLVTSQVCHLPE